MRYIFYALLITLIGCETLPDPKPRRITRTEKFQHLCKERYVLAGYAKISKKTLLKCMTKFEYQYQKRFHVDNTNISVENSSSSSSSGSVTRALSSILVD